MTTTRIEFNLLDGSRPFAPQQFRIALIVRGMEHPGVAPHLQGHADCVLPLGAPVGFFADEAFAGSSGESVGDVLWGIDLLTGGFAGHVFSYADFLRERRPYVSKADAIAQHIVSTILVIDVSQSEAQRFQECWEMMRADPGHFAIGGWNCSTHAALAFSYAGLLTTPTRAMPGESTGEINGLDSPTNLYLQLLASPLNPRCQSYTGYLGFEPRPGGQYEVSIDSVA